MEKQVSRNPLPIQVIFNDTLPTVQRPAGQLGRNPLPIQVIFNKQANSGLG